MGSEKMPMIRRGLLLLALGSLLGVLFATYLGPPTALGDEPPPELQANPAQPTRTAKDISRPMIDATARVRPAVVEIVMFGRDFRGRTARISNGSGFIISKQGHILTNRHVVAVRGASQIQVRLDDGRTFEKVRILGTDPRSDVAVVKVDPGEHDLPVAAIGDSDALEVGELVLAIGSPYKLASSVSLGVVSATGRTGVIPDASAAEEFIQTDAALNPGNSGGPLVNLDGQVVGINTAIAPPTGANVGVGFSIPINLARSVALALIERGVVRRGYLGVRGKLVGKPDSTRADGYRIDHVVPESPAAKAGLQPDDIIVALDGRPLEDIQILYSRLTQAGPDGEVDLSVRRGEKLRMVHVRLGEAKPGSFGIEVASLTPKRARELQLPTGVNAGVVVTRVQEGSIAAEAEPSNRLLPGDVIVRINWTGGRIDVAERSDFERVMEYFHSQPPRQVEFIVATKEGFFRVRLQPQQDS
jgi:serine protease Do